MKSKARGYLKLLKSKDIVCFLMDVLSPIRRLSLQLQERTSAVFKQQVAVSSTLTIVQKFQERFVHIENKRKT